MAKTSCFYQWFINASSMLDKLSEDNINPHLHVKRLLYKRNMSNKKNHMILYMAVFHLLLCSNPLCRLTLYFNASIANHMDNRKFTRNKI